MELRINKRTKVQRMFSSSLCRRDAQWHCSPRTFPMLIPRPTLELSTTWSVHIRCNACTLQYHRVFSGQCNILLLTSVISNICYCEGDANITADASVVTTRIVEVLGAGMTKRDAIPCMTCLQWMHIGYTRLSITSKGNRKWSTLIMTWQRFPASWCDTHAATSRSQCTNGKISHEQTKDNTCALSKWSAGCSSESPLHCCNE